MSEAMDKALSKDRDEWSVDYDAEPGIAGNAFERGWKAAQAVSSPDRTLGRLREWASRKIEPEFDEDGDPILSYEYVGGAMGARRDVLQILAALSTQPAAGEVECSHSYSRVKFDGGSQAIVCNSCDHIITHIKQRQPDTELAELFPGTLAALEHLSIRPEVQ